MLLHTIVKERTYKVKKRRRMMFGISSALYGSENIGNANRRLKKLLVLCVVTAS